MASLGAIFVWNSEQASLNQRASGVSRAVERRLVDGEELDADMLRGWVGGTENHEAAIVVQGPDGEQYRVGPQFPGRVVRSWR
ncbi:hypothetical protein [Georgenia yuyongxinii]